MGLDRLSNLEIIVVREIILGPSGGCGIVGILSSCEVSPVRLEAPHDFFVSCVQRILEAAQCPEQKKQFERMPPWMKTITLR
jgi:hypothetical protein